MRPRHIRRRHRERSMFGGAEFPFPCRMGLEILGVTVAPGPFARIGQLPFLQITTIN